METSNQRSIPQFTQGKNVATGDILSEMMGNWGLWQFRTVITVYLTKIPSAWFMACLIFTAPHPWIEDYWCDTSEYENNTSLFSIAHPNITIADGTFIPNYCNVLLKNSSITLSKPCNSFQYNIDKYTSVVTQFDLLCSKSILIAITQSFHLLGVLIGGIAANELMVYFSPKFVMLVGMVFLLPCGISTGYAPWFWLHAILRCMSAACCALSFTPGGVIMSDITGGTAKIIVNANFEQFWSIGVILLTVIGYFTTNWAQIYISITTPMILVIIFWPWITDSPRWHLEKNNIEKVQTILEEAAKMNNSNKVIPDNLCDILRNEASIVAKRNLESKSQDNWSHLFSLNNSILIVTCVCTTWALILTSYYGTLLNIRSFGRQYLFLTTPIAGLCELLGGFCGFLILLYSKCKWKIIGLFTFFTGIVNFTIWFLPTHIDGSHILSDLILVSMINKIGISACLCVLLTCTAELAPFPHKKRLVYASTVVGRIVFITAPLIGTVAKYGDAVSLSAFGLLTMISGLCIFIAKPIKSTTQNNAQNGIYSINISNSNS